MNSYGRDNVNNENKKKIKSFFTKETLGVVLCLFTTLALICVITGDAIFSIPGGAIKNFFMGILGYVCYPVLVWVGVRGVCLIANKYFKLSKAFVAFAVTFLVLLGLLLQVVLSNVSADSNFGTYLGQAYLQGNGILFAFIGYLFKLMDVTGIVILSVLLSLNAFLIVRTIIKPKTKVAVKTADTFATSYEKADDTMLSNTAGEMEYPVDVEIPSFKTQAGRQRLFINGDDEFHLKTKRDLKNEAKGEKSVQDEISKTPITPSPYSRTSPEVLRERLQNVITPAPIDVEDTLGRTTVSDTIPKEQPVESVNIPIYEHSEEESATHAEEFSRYANGEVDFSATAVNGETETQSETPKETYDETSNDIFSFEEEQEVIEEVENYEINGIKEQDYTEKPSVFEKETTVFEPKPQSSVFENEPLPKEEIKEEPPKRVQPINMFYDRPPISTLVDYNSLNNSKIDNHEERIEIIQKTLNTFGIDVEPCGYIQGPTVTRYEMSMPDGILVNKLFSCEDNLSMRLAVKSGVRILAPIPGKNRVGFEVANTVPITVGLRKILENTANEKYKDGALMFALGEDLEGKPQVDNLAKGPHYLIAGATGSGKSVCIHTIIVSLLMRYSPEELRLILIDPKNTEFKVYEGLPHLVTNEIIKPPKKVVATLKWAYEEMERRNQLFNESGVLVRDIDDYNKHIASNTVPKIPRIVIIIDELADLMLSEYKKELDDKICAIAAKARSAGIHLLVATQRPSTDVVTGTIKANLLSRIVLRVGSQVDSRVVMDENGAEKLLGNGDMLYKNSNGFCYERYQGAFLTLEEIFAIVSYIKEHNECYFDETLQAVLDNCDKKEEAVAEVSASEETDSNDTPYLKEAVKVAIQVGSMSTSLLMRKFPIGNGRAGRLVELMEKRGYITPAEGSKARRVLVTREQFENDFGTPFDE